MYVYCLIFTEIVVNANKHVGICKQPMQRNRFDLFPKKAFSALLAL